jgi:hypothetical protein
MKDLTRLPSPELVRIVADIQTFLWLDLDRDDEPFWNPDKEWDWDTLEHIAGVLTDAGLRPVEPSPATP